MDAQVAGTQITERGVRAFLKVVGRYAGDWLEDRRYMQEHQALIEELEASGDLDALLEVVGATREELKAWAISPLASGKLLEQMMQRLGISPEHVARAVVEDAQRACRCCAEWRQCRRWVRDGAPEDAYKAFCPNARLLDRLAGGIQS